MKLAHGMALFALLIFMAGADADRPKTLDEAWAYVNDASNPDGWITVATAHDANHYFQCAYYPKHIKCELPVSAKELPGNRLSGESELSLTPYPDMPGTLFREYKTPTEVAAFKKTLASFSLDPRDVYGKLVDQQRHPVGTSHDVDVALPHDYRSFDALVKGVFAQVWGWSEKDGYTVTTDKDP